ncbi:amidohydrolase family protein [Pinibacter aurantiacus]|uniref:Amidohydrolase family protein n=1 Tax=Pinibacter aurantiacus TaxID=2851599 RepID=A0A9E2SFW2_9BACT|nr:amidohydrolase family protein [Pinibacter aurantiacus]MBV4360500.1 amidohydrolase family protein [Pinibacter aurantiacus]
MQYYNVHTHSFTMNNAPKDFLQLYLPKAVANLVDKITDVQAGSWLIQKILENVGGNGGKRYASFLKIGKSRNQLEVFRQLKDQYKDTSFKFVALTMEMEQCGAGKSSSGYEGQLEEIISVKKQFPDNLLLFLGIDPRWKSNGFELRDTVIKYFEQKIDVGNNRTVYPFVGLKMYPSMGFYPFDEKLKPTFAWAAENNVPVLSHCNFLGGIYNNDAGFINTIIKSNDPYNGNAMYPPNGVTYSDQKKFGRWIMGRQKSRNNLNRCSYFMEPYAFYTLMDYFKKNGTPLKLCLAHFGGGNQINAILKPEKADEEDLRPYGAKNENWYTQIKSMMTEFPSLYTDISYALADETIHDQMIADIQNPSYAGRVMFGTDYFLTEREGPEMGTYEKFRHDASVSGNAWDIAAHYSIEKFLGGSKYFQPTP